MNMARALIIYLSPYDILRPRTNQVSDVRFAEGFAQNQCETHLIVPFVHRADNILKEEVPHTYGLQADIDIHYLPTRFDKDVKGIFPLLLTAWYGIRCVQTLLRQHDERIPCYLISRSTHLLRPYFFLRKLFTKRFQQVHIIHWAHDFKTSASYRAVYRKSDFLLATNSSILKEMLQLARKQESEGAITLNPITAAQAEEHITRENARKETQLESLDKPLIVYTGKLGKKYDREALYILGAAKNLAHCTFLFTGGKPDVVEHWKKYCRENQMDNVIFTGYIHQYNRIRYYQAAADVLVSYYTSQGHDVRYNLPNKLCEYMLTGNVIVSPNYPATSDLLNEHNCIFAAPEDTDALTAALRTAVENPETSQRKALQAAKDVREITFKKITGSLLELFPRRES